MTLEVEDLGGFGPDLLLLHGGGDNFETWLTSPKARRRLAGLSARVEWLDTGHYLHWDAPEEIARRVREVACGS